MGVKDKAKVIEDVEGVKGIMVTGEDGELVYSKISPDLEEKLVNIFPCMENIISLLKIKPKNLTVQFAPDLRIMILMKDAHVIYVLASRYVDVLGMKTLIEG